MTRPHPGLAVAVLTVLAVLWLGARTASADNVDKLIQDLSSSEDYKVRLSAAASLAKLGDDRAIPAFIKALGKDKEKTVRGAAAVGLGKVVTSDTDPGLLEDAIAALDKSAKKDKDSFVKKQSKKALAKLQKLASGGGGATVSGGGIYVDLGEMSAKAGDTAKMKELMRKTADKTFARNASEMVTKWPGSKKAPTKKQLKGVQAFHVDGTLNELTTKAKGSATIVTCKVNMLIATYPDKSMFGFLNGGASVQASSDEKDIELAKTDCVAAVVEDLVIKKIIPTIKAKAGSR